MTIASRELWISIQVDFQDGTGFFVTTTLSGRDITFTHSFSLVRLETRARARCVSRWHIPWIMREDQGSLGDNLRCIEHMSDEIFVVLKMWQFWEQTLTNVHLYPVFIQGLGPDMFKFLYPAGRLVGVNSNTPWGKARHVQSAREHEM